RPSPICFSRVATRATYGCRRFSSRWTPPGCGQGSTSSYRTVKPTGKNTNENPNPDHRDGPGRDSGGGRLWPLFRRNGPRNEDGGFRGGRRRCATGGRGRPGHGEKDSLLARPDGAGTEIRQAGQVALHGHAACAGV